MPSVLPVVAPLIGQPLVRQLGGYIERHLHLSRITNVTAYHLGGAVRAREWITGYAEWRFNNVQRLSNSKVASAQN